MLTTEKNPYKTPQRIKKSPNIFLIDFIHTTGSRNQSEYKKLTPRALEFTHDQTFNCTIVKILTWSILPLLKFFLFLCFYNLATIATHTQPQI